ncbi:MAG TPA: chromosomal replication initiator protein DnaA [Solirubrobacteraceae bacterium]|nr:chromosomal replication initiator protein DnaA [Solirubrobacteraceae bacterium]
MNTELDQIWMRVQADLAAAVDEPTYRVWLEPLSPIELSASRITVHAPPQIRGWVNERFGRLLQTCVADVVGRPVTVVMSDADPASTEARGRGGRDLTIEAPRLANPGYTFDRFVIGDSNRLAHAAALTVAEMPGQAYNPLFICGPPGVGKTHLMHSIANLLAEHSPGLVLRTATGESFASDFRNALGASAIDNFKSRFRDISVLLVDDVQFLERKTRTEEEFFHTFNALHEAGAQIVLTSDRPPRDLQALEDRLRERFEAGLVADIAPPDLKTRLAILRKRALQDGIEGAPDAVLELIAQRITMNVRALEGALIRVVAYSSLASRPISRELTAEVLDSLYPAPPRQRCTIDDIQATICSHFSLSREELLSSARVSRVAWPRQLAMYLSRELTEESLPYIGRHFGGRDHTTVLHACRRAGTRLEHDATCREAVESIRRELGQDLS